jgi:hypothetical protein
MLLFEFESFPMERDLIGRMLLAYGELEFAVLGVVSQVMSDDIPTTTRVLFRVRGESFVTPNEGFGRKKQLRSGCPFQGRLRNISAPTART